MRVGTRPRPHARRPAGRRHSAPATDEQPKEFQQNNEQQMNNHWGRVTHPPAPSFPARIQAGRSRRLPPIPDAPHGHGLTARRSFAAIPAAAAAPSSQRNAEFASDRAQGFLLLRTRRRRVIRSGTVAGGLSAAASRRKALRKPKVASDRAASRFGFRSARRRFHVPSVAVAPLRADGCHATGRGRRQPVRRGAVFARGYKPQPACPPSCRLPPAATPRHDQQQCKLPRQVSAEGLARAFAPRRATSGLVRIPPASDAYRGESRSLGKRIDAAQCWRLYQPHPRSRHAGFRCASALRGVAGVATCRFTRSCYTVRFSMWQPPRPLAKATDAAAACGAWQPLAIRRTFRFPVTGCHTATA